MSVTQYVGARYVPLFANPIDWDITKAYEPLTIVYHQGNSYTSRQSVPTGTDINNETYWALTGNYNAQIEQYRAEVRTYDGRINENKTNIVAETTRSTAAETALDGKIADETTRSIAAESTNANAITTETTRATEAESAITDAYKAADTKLSDDITAAYKDADTALSNSITAAYNDADTALSNSITAEFSTNFNKINSDITALQKNKFSKMLYIGDSWGQGWTGSNNPSSGLAAYLGEALGCETVNKSVSAAGYIPNGDSLNFIGQLNSVSDSEKNGVDLVVVQGGINDGGSSFSYANIVAAATNLYNAIINAYPNAKIVVINTPLAYGRNFGSSNVNEATDPPQDMKPYAAINEAVRNCSNPRKIQLIQSSYRWAQSFDPSDSYDGAHVNASGYKKFADIAATCITNNTEYWPSYYEKISLNSKFSTIRCAYAYETNGVCGICINAMVDSSKTLGNTETICTLNQRFSRPRSMFGTGYNTANSGFYAFDNIYGSNGVCQNVNISQQAGSLIGETWIFINTSWEAGC